MARGVDLRDVLRVEPGRSARLERLDPGRTFGHDRASAERATAANLIRLSELQDRFWAEANRAVLVVLQGIDAAGKDGTINKVIYNLKPEQLSADDRAVMEEMLAKAHDNR